MLQDLNVLTDVSREMRATYAHEDPLEYGRQWGMIENKNVKVSLSASQHCHMRTSKAKFISTAANRSTTSASASVNRALDYDILQGHSTRQASSTG